VSPTGRAAAGGQAADAARDRPSELVTLVTRLVLAQAALTGAIGLSYGRRNVSWIMITLMLAIALCGLAAIVRSGSHAAWIFAVAFEAAYAAVGLVQFLTARFLGGTLFAVVTLSVLVHPTVIRAFGGSPRRGSQPLGGARLDQLGEPADDALGGRAAG
jgi:hypothetical protein